MSSSESRSDRLLAIVTTLLDPPSDVCADRLDALEDEFCELIEHPGGAALLHYPEMWGLGDSPTPAQIVSEAINWTPKILTMTVQSARPHCKLAGSYVYTVAGNNIATQVVSKLRLSPGQTCEVALSGAKLPNGTIAKHKFIANVFTAGEIVPPEDR